MKIGFIGFGMVGNTINLLIKEKLKLNISKYKEILKNVEFIRIDTIAEVKKYNFDLIYVHAFINNEEIDILKKVCELNKTHIVGMTHGKLSTDEINKVKIYLNNLIILNPNKREVFVDYIAHQLQNLFLPSLVGLLKEDIIAVLKKGFLIETYRSNTYKKNEHPTNPCNNSKSIKGAHLLIIGNNKNENSIDLDDINEIGELITTELNKDTNIIWTFIEDTKLKGTEKYFEMLVTKDMENQ